MPKPWPMVPLIVAVLLETVAQPLPGKPPSRPTLARPPLTAPAAGADGQSTRTPPKAPAAPADGEDGEPKIRNISNTAQDADEDEGRLQPSSRIIVTARRLDAARTRIDAGLGATVYSLTNDTIENRPGGETGSLSEILAQAPGVTLSGTTLNVRGSAANQVRINNVILPEAISDPADLLSSRLAETTRLITGTLPAQFGFAPAGVISVTTKNGLYEHGGQAEFFAATNGRVEPAFEWSGSAEGTSLFASGELEHEHSQIADSEGKWGEDRRTAIDGLGFADHIIGENDRVSLIIGGAHERHRIGETNVGPGTVLNTDGYGAATYQHSHGGFTLQASLFGGAQYAKARFGSTTYARDRSWGTQIDASDALDATNMVRFGLLETRSTARELGLGAMGSSAGRTSVAIYAQDDWVAAPSLTLIAGARLEWLRSFGSAPKIEPRASLVWKSPNGFSAHVGYARFASAPPLGGEGTRGLADESDDDFDAGVQRKLGSFTLGLDGYWRSARNLIAEHQTPGSAVATSFEFGRGRMSGVELSGTYAHRGTTAWANVSLAHAEGRTIVGADTLFAPESIAAASQRFVPLASDRPLTVSAGFSRSIGRLSIGGDVLMSSGAVRTLHLADPNGSRHSPYALVGLSAVYHVSIAERPADLRMDLTNLTDVRDVASDATSLDGGWTRLGEGRAIMIGIEQGF